MPDRCLDVPVSSREETHRRLTYFNGISAPRQSSVQSVGVDTWLSGRTMMLGGLSPYRSHRPEEVMSRQSDMDNHANQFNPNHDAYWESRAYYDRPDDWDDGITEEDDSSDSKQSQVEGKEQTAISVLVPVSCGPRVSDHFAMIDYADQTERPRHTPNCVQWAGHWSHCWCAEPLNSDNDSGRTTTILAGS